MVLLACYLLAVEFLFVLKASVNWKLQKADQKAPALGHPSVV